MRALTLKGITKTFNTHQNRAVAALDDISLNIRAGEFACFIGSTGCGKTTLLRIIAGLESPDDGQIILDGSPVQDLHKICTLVFQQYSLFPWLKVIDNVAFPMLMKKISRLLWIRVV